MSIHRWLEIMTGGSGELMRVGSVLLAQLNDGFNGGIGGLLKMSFHCLGGPVGVAGFEAVEDAEVVVQGGWVNAVHGIANGFTHGLDEGGLAGNLAGETGVSAGLGDGAVKLLIQMPLMIGQFVLLQSREGLLQTLHGVWVHPRGSEACGLDFQESADGVEIADLVGAEGLKHRAAVSAQLDQAEAGQFEQSFAHGSAADGEALRDARFRETLATFESAAEAFEDETLGNGDLAGGGAFGWGGRWHESRRVCNNRGQVHVRLLYTKVAPGMFRFVFAALSLLVPALPVCGRSVDFQRDVAPVLEAKCLGCHTANIAKGDVILSTVEGMAEYVEAGHAEKSSLYQVVVPESEGADPEMPKKGEPLTNGEVALFREWIEGGAEWPAGLVLKEASKAGKDWWAYRELKFKLPKRPPESNPVDAFVNEKLTESGLKMNSEADARTLIRRMCYDLTGLPPTMAEVTAFERAFAKDADGSVERLINRLLASPQYGERWGRHWLDVVRFGESNGYERNVVIDSLWPFRDYVIESINADKPFDQLIREHLAGDVIGKGNPKVEIGSAFLVAGPYDDVKNQDAAQSAQIRANTLDEIINATGEAFLGMTLGCARCHDHKFDPILQRDYYAMYATFAGVRHGERVWATPEAMAAHEKAIDPLNEEKADLEAKQKELEAVVRKRANEHAAKHEKTWVRDPVDRTGTEERFEPVEARWVRLVSEGGDEAVSNRKSFGVDEFEIWTSGRESRNVALEGKASGAARVIEDFPNAYGAHLAIDGKAGARFLAVGGELVIELPAVEKIERVLFSSARGEQNPEHRKFAFVAEYRIEISNDGKHWKTVADSLDRKPANPSHRAQRLRDAEIRAEEEAALAELAAELAKVTREIAAVPVLPKAWIGTRNAKDAEGPFHLFIGGSPQRLGDAVVPASLSTLSEVASPYELKDEIAEEERRMKLAEWISSKENPLTWRVLANRVWHHHFGTGIVDTPNDFGYMGGRPTHPELLDFLAAELMKNGFRLKALHRLIMTSKAYRQSSQWNEVAAKLDGDARLLWRFPPRRLSAEEIRDTILFVAGKLDPKMGGPGFRLYHFMQDNVCTYEPLDEHGPETYRRAVYHQNARASVVDLMTDFDQPDCAFSTPRRAETTTPLQALTLLNHSFTINMAEAMSARITEESDGKELHQQVGHAFRLAYQRPPTGEERAKSVAVVTQHGMTAFCRALLNSSELIFCD